MEYKIGDRMILKESSSWLTKKFNGAKCTVVSEEEYEKNKGPCAFYDRIPVKLDEAIGDHRYWVINPKMIEHLPPIVQDYGIGFEVGKKFKLSEGVATGYEGKTIIIIEKEECKQYAACDLSDQKDRVPIKMVNPSPGQEKYWFCTKDKMEDIEQKTPNVKEEKETRASDALPDKGAFDKKEEEPKGFRYTIPSKNRRNRRRKNKRKTRVRVRTETHCEHCGARRPGETHTDACPKKPKPWNKPNREEIAAIMKRLDYQDFIEELSSIPWQHPSEYAPSKRTLY
jgi:hypothetical protein